MARRCDLGGTLLPWHSASLEHEDQSTPVRGLAACYQTAYELVGGPPYSAVMDVRKMLPSKRGEATKWELSIDGRPVGWIDERMIGGARSTFYRLVMIDPRTGKHVDLERSAEFEDRVDVAEQFIADPSEFERHMRL